MKKTLKKGSPAAKKRMAHVRSKRGNHKPSLEKTGTYNLSDQPLLDMSGVTDPRKKNTLFGIAEADAKRRGIPMAQ